MDTHLLGCLHIDDVQAALLFLTQEIIGNINAK